MKTNISIFAAVSAVVVGLAVSANVSGPAGAVIKAHRAMPTHGAVFDVGSKHAVSYFTRENGVCNVTLMIGDKANAEGEGASIGTRMSFAVDATHTARADTADGQSLEFTCAKDAATMDVRPVARLAYVAQNK